MCSMPAYFLIHTKSEANRNILWQQKYFSINLFVAHYFVHSRTKCRHLWQPSRFSPGQHAISFSFLTFSEVQVNLFDRSSTAVSQTAETTVLAYFADQFLITVLVFRRLIFSALFKIQWRRLYLYIFIVINVFYLWMESKFYL